MKNWSGLLELAKSAMEGYSRGDREFVREHKGGGVSFAKLLKLASMQACSLVDLVRAPEEMLSPRLAVTGGVPTPRIRRVVIAPGLLAQVERHLEDLLATDERTKLPTKRAVFREFGLECNRVWRMYPGLSAVYSAELTRRKRLQKALAMRRVVLEAKTLVEVLVYFQVYASSSALAAAVRDECGVPRDIAWRGMRMAIAELSNDVGTLYKVKRSGASVSSSELRDLRAGYVGSQQPRALAW